MSARVISDRGFVLGAGYGTRMRPLTDTVPKPLAPVAGRPIIAHVLDVLGAAGIKEAVINTHHLKDLMHKTLQQNENPRVVFSPEEALLDTGGGIRAALGHFGDEAFFVLSGDSLWEEGPGAPLLARMATAWDPARMDILIALQPLASMSLTACGGDYDLLPGGRARRALDKKGEYAFTSIRINHPRIFTGAPAGPFSYLKLLDEAEARGRLFALVHEGAWHHISTMQDLAAVDGHYRGREDKGKRR